MQDEVNQHRLTELKVHKSSEEDSQITSDNELNEINEELEKEALRLTLTKESEEKTIKNSTMPKAFREVIDTDFPEHLGFLAKFNWQKTDLLQHEFKELCTTLITNKECYAQHKYDIGNPDLEYHITLKKRCKT